MGGKAEFLAKAIKSSPLPNVSQLPPKLRHEAADAYWNTIFDCEGPRSIERPGHPQEMGWAKRFFKPFSMIYHAAESLKDIEVYVRRFPFGGTRVSRSGYLRHNIQVYFQEVFVLRDRLIRFLNTLEKDYSNHAIGNKLKAINAPLCRAMKACLKELIECRKLHVHELGFDDEGLSRLETLELLDSDLIAPKTPDEKRMAAVYRVLREDGYKEQRRLWANSIHQWNCRIDEMLDLYFEILGALLFTRGGRLKYPPVSLVQSESATEEA